MILKTFESKKINLDTNKIVLFYGQNDGHKEEEISKILITNKNREIIKYTENEVLENSENFYNNILSESFFSQNSIVVPDCGSIYRPGSFLLFLPTNSASGILLGPQ